MCSVYYFFVDTSWSIKRRCIFCDRMRPIAWSSAGTISCFYWHISLQLLWIVSCCIVAGTCSIYASEQLSPDVHYIHMKEFHMSFQSNMLIHHSLLTTLFHTQYYYFPYCSLTKHLLHYSFYSFPLTSPTLVIASFLLLLCEFNS